jgi:radical SAM protein with 4Fe4S-binding SPASM domain
MSPWRAQKDAFTIVSILSRGRAVMADLAGQQAKEQNLSVIGRSIARSGTALRLNWRRIGSWAETLWRSQRRGISSDAISAMSAEDPPRSLPVSRIVPISQNPPVSQEAPVANIIFHCYGSFFERIPDHEGADSGYFWSLQYGEALDPGVYVARFQVLVPSACNESARIRLEVLSAHGDDSGLLGRREIKIGPEFHPKSDGLLVFFVVKSSGGVELRCWTSSKLSQFFLRSAQIKRAGQGNIHDPGDWASCLPEWDTWPIDRIESLVIGISSTCTASCVHCPTNKDWLELPRSRSMSDEIFEKLITGTAELGIPVRSIAFGLHAEPFVDPKLTLRAKRVRELFPQTFFMIATNGSIFDERRHAELFEYVNCVSVHIESLDPDTYNDLMRPLKLPKTQSTVMKMVGIGGLKTTLAVPLHKRNIGEYHELSEWWRSIGGGSVVALPFSNRGSFASEILNLHLFPMSGICRQTVAFSLIVDCDGEVLSCCQDFPKKSGIGDLRRQSVREVIYSEQRKKLFTMLKNQQWAGIEMCRTCLWDETVSVANAVRSPR